MATSTTLHSILFNDSDSDEEMDDSNETGNANSLSLCGGTGAAAPPQQAIARSLVPSQEPQEQRARLARREENLVQYSTTSTGRLANTTKTTITKTTAAMTAATTTRRGESCEAHKRTRPTIAVSVPPTTRTMSSTVRDDGGKDDKDTMRHCSRPVQRDASIKLFLRSLLQYLKEAHPELFRRATQVARDCSERHKAGDPAYSNLTASLQQRLLQTVGRTHWTAAIHYLKQRLRQKEGESTKSTTPTPTPGPTTPRTAPAQITTPMPTPTQASARPIPIPPQQTCLRTTTMAATATTTTTTTKTKASRAPTRQGPIVTKPDMAAAPAAPTTPCLPPPPMTPEELQRAIRVRDRLLSDKLMLPSSMESTKTRQARTMDQAKASRRSKRNPRQASGQDRLQNASARVAQQTKPTTEGGGAAAATTTTTVAIAESKSNAVSFAFDGSGWGARNVVSARTAWARLRLSEQTANDEGLIPGVSTTLVTATAPRARRRHAEGNDAATTTTTTLLEWRNGETAEGDAALALLSEATQVYLRCILQGAVGAARQREVVDGRRLWQGSATDAMPVLSLRFGCHVGRQVALAEGKAAQAIHSFETVLARDAQGPAKICVSGDRALDPHSATSMKELSLRPQLKHAAQRAADRAKRLLGNNDDDCRDPFANPPKRAKITCLDFETFMTFPSNPFACKSVLQP